MTPISYRDVEDLLAQRGIEVSYETIRRWVTRFGPQIGRPADSQPKRASCVRVLDRVLSRLPHERQ
jgi:transposase-like protein